MSKLKFQPFRIEETEFAFHPKIQEHTDAFLRCNPEIDGYVFVPNDKKIGKIITGAFITENELGNPHLIPTPSMVKYYKWATRKFYNVIPEVAL